MPSIEAMLMTLAGLSFVAALRSSGQRLREKERRLEIEIDDLVPAFSGNSSKSAAQAAALLTRMSSFSSRPLSSAASFSARLRAWKYRRAAR